MAVDAAGNIYIADTNNCRIRKVTPNGTISTIAGDGVPNYAGDGGPAVQAELSFPRGVAVDAAGNVFIAADTNNARIRKISTVGTISTVAGNGTFGYAGDGGPAINAEFFNPYDVAVDKSGDLFIVERGNQRVRKVTPDGVIMTIAGNGTFGYSGDGGQAISAQLNFPVALTVDTSGNVFIADADNNCVRKVSPGGIITTVAGNGVVGFSGDGGPATSAQINDPEGVAVDAAGNLYVSDEDNQRVRVVINGIITTIAGNGTAGFRGDGGPATMGEFNLPQGLGIGQGGSLYIVDSGNNRIRQLTPSGASMIPSIAKGGVISAYAFGGFSSIAPGSWIEMYGANLAADSRSWTGADFNGNNAPESLDGTVVSIGGQTAFLDYISPAIQVNAQVPSGIGTGVQPVIVMTSAGSSNPYSIMVNSTQPGLLAPASFSVGGIQYAAALFPDNATYVLPPSAVPGVPARQAKSGDTITFYGIGFGAVAPASPAGQIVTQDNILTTSFAVFFGSAQASLIYWGLAPGAVGLYQFNVVVPNVPDSDAVPLTFSLGGVSGTQVLYTAVRND